MNIEKTPIPGAFIITPKAQEDERGSFSRVWCSEELSAYGMNTSIAQCSRSYNRKADTLRGMHFQREPYGEEKYVTCISGAVYDVIVDVRENSPAYLSWFGVQLTQKERKTLYIPKGCAHGFLTLTADSELYYQITTPYHQSSGAGVRYDDPRIGIDWQLGGIVPIMSEKDKQWPLL